MLKFIQIQVEFEEQSKAKQKHLEQWYESNFKWTWNPYSLHK